MLVFLLCACSTIAGSICNYPAKTNIMGILNQVAQYLYLKKKDPNAPKSQFVRAMHGINRITILLFIAGLIILAIKLLRHR